MRDKPVEIILGLGTNMGDRTSILTRAVTWLVEQGGVEGITLSSLFESEALLLPGASLEWNIPFLNIAVKGYTFLDPWQLLVSVKEAERHLGRKERGRWSPREIDIDILAYGTEHITSDLLHIPHIALLERPFALLPFAELWPNWRYPVKGGYYGKTAEELLASLPEEAVKTRKIGALQHSI